MESAVNKQQGQSIAEPPDGVEQSMSETPASRNEGTSLQVGHAVQTAVNGPRKLWLDMLPIEVCSRIAKFVSFGECLGTCGETIDALHLAEASPQQRRAVVSTLSYKLSFMCSLSDSDQEDVNARWSSVFVREGVRGLDLRREYWGGVDYNLLKSQALRCVSIYADSPVLGALAECQFLRVLDILVTDHNSALVCQLLSRLSLEELRIRCMAGSDQCPLGNEECFSGKRNIQNSSCPQLRVLDIDCIYCIHRDHPYWKFLPTMPSIREVSLGPDIRVPDYALPLLQNLDAVKINRAHNAYQLALSIGASVTSLYPEGDVLGQAAVTRLSDLSGLRELHICLKKDAESALPDAVRVLPELRSLKIVWERSGTTILEKDELSVADGEAVLLAVQKAPKLEELGLYEVQIAFGKVAGMFQSIGSRLRAFTASLRGPEDSYLEPPELLLEAAAEHNPGLLLFEVDIGNAPCSRPEYLQRRRRVSKALCMLRRRAPFVDVEWDQRTHLRQKCSWCGSGEHKYPCAAIYSGDFEDAIDPEHA